MIQLINGVRTVVLEDKSIGINVEDVAVGLGMTNDRDGVIRWDNLYRSFLFAMEDMFGKSSTTDEWNENGTLSKRDIMLKVGFIKEEIFYAMAFRAKSKMAQDFRRKIAREILPVLRRTGMYTTEELDKKIAEGTVTLQEAYENQLQQKEDVINALSFENDRLRASEYSARQEVNRVKSIIISNQSYLMTEEEAQIKLEPFTSLVRRYDGNLRIDAYGEYRNKPYVCSKIDSKTGEVVYDFRVINEIAKYPDTYCKFLAESRDKREAYESMNKRMY